MASERIARSCQIWVARSPLDEGAVGRKWRKRPQLRKAKGRQTDETRFFCLFDKLALRNVLGGLQAVLPSDSLEPFGDLAKECLEDSEVLEYPTYRLQEESNASENATGGSVPWTGSIRESRRRGLDSKRVKKNTNPIEDSVLRSANALVP